MSNVLNLNENEKAIFYVHFWIDRSYGPVTFIGALLAMVFLFKGMSNLLSLLTPIIGYLLSYIDVNLTMYFLIRKPDAYAQAFRQVAMTWPYKGIEPFASYSTELKWFSQIRLKETLQSLKSYFLYESYKLVIVGLAGILALSTSGRKAEVFMFNLGLYLLFWGLFYLILWNKKYYWKAAAKLGLTEERSKEIKEFKRKEWGSL